MASNMTNDERFERDCAAASARVREWAFGRYRDAPEEYRAAVPRSNQHDARNIGSFEVIAGRKGAAATKRARRGTTNRARTQAAYRAKMRLLPCTVEGCTRGQHSGGMCAAHDIAAKRAGRPYPHCMGCGVQLTHMHALRCNSCKFQRNAEEQAQRRAALNLAASVEQRWQEQA